jgi:transcriptional regulator with XRE-family HTH domain
MTTEGSLRDRPRPPSGGTPRWVRRGRQKRGRGVEAHTTLGRRIALLAEDQRQLARVFGVSQQSVSKKLRGEAVLLVPELERVAAHYRVPMTYFFEEGGDEDELPRPDVSAVCERVKRAPGIYQEIVLLLGKLSQPGARELLRKARELARSGQDGDSRLSALAAKGFSSYGDA